MRGARDHRLRQNAATVACLLAKQASLQEDDDDDDDDDEDDERDRRTTSCQGPSCLLSLPPVHACPRLDFQAYTICQCQKF